MVDVDHYRRFQIRESDFDLSYVKTRFIVKARGNMTAQSRIVDILKGMPNGGNCGHVMAAMELAPSEFNRKKISAQLVAMFRARKIRRVGFGMYCI